MSRRYPDPMVSSDDVNGTEVYSPSREKVGHIDHLVIDKQSGKVAYAIMHFGGFLGIGEQEHAIPWAKLDYDTQVGGFVTDITPEQLQAAPAPRDDWYTDRDWQERSYRHFGLTPYGL